MASAFVHGKEIRRVEVWRDGAWRPSRLAGLFVGEVFRMFESDGEIVESAAPWTRVTALAVEDKDLPGRYSIASEPCDDPEKST